MAWTAGSLLGALRPVCRACCKPCVAACRADLAAWRSLWHSRRRQAADMWQQRAWMVCVLCCYEQGGGGMPTSCGSSAGERVGSAEGHGCCPALVRACRRVPLWGCTAMAARLAGPRIRPMPLCQHSCGRHWAYAAVCGVCVCCLCSPLGHVRRRGLRSGAGCAVLTQQPAFVSTPFVLHLGLLPASRAWVYVHDGAAERRLVWVVVGGGSGCVGMDGLTTGHEAQTPLQTWFACMEESALPTRNASTHAWPPV